MFLFRYLKMHCYRGENRALQESNIMFCVVGPPDASTDVNNLQQEVLYVSPAEGAHLNLCTEAIALLFQFVHFSFLSCHGDGFLGDVTDGKRNCHCETGKREKKRGWE